VFPDDVYAKMISAMPNVADIARCRDETAAISARTV
jgi:hypothetical protein